MEDNGAQGPMPGPTGTDDSGPDGQMMKAITEMAKQVESTAKSIEALAGLFSKFLGKE